MKSFIAGAITLVAASMASVTHSASFDLTNLSVSGNSYMTTSGGITLTVSTPTAGHNLACDCGFLGTDGLGASGGILDGAPLDNNESLQFTFSEDVTVGTLDLYGWGVGDSATVSSANGDINLSGPLLVLNGMSSFDLSSLGSISSFTVHSNALLGNFTVAGLSDVSTSEVPVPAAAWLFGSAILGLFGRRQVTRK